MILQHYLLNVFKRNKPLVSFDSGENFLVDDIIIQDIRESRVKPNVSHVFMQEVHTCLLKDLDAASVLKTASINPSK